MPPLKFLCHPPPPCPPPEMRSVLCIKIHQKIFLRYAAVKPNGMKCDCITIHALHGCVINNVIIQSTAFASLHATSLPGSYRLFCRLFFRMPPTIFHRMKCLPPPPVWKSWWRHCIQINREYCIVLKVRITMLTNCFGDMSHFTQVNPR